MSDFTIEQEWAMLDFWNNEVPDSDKRRRNSNRRVKFEELTYFELSEIWEWYQSEQTEEWTEEQ
jgi:hypothetical protein